MYIRLVFSCTVTILLSNVGLLIFKDLKFCRLSNFCFKDKILWNFKVTGKRRKFTNCLINTRQQFSQNVIDLSTHWWSKGNLLAATAPSVDIALDKLPVDDGKGVLTSHLKYFYRAISPPHVQQKIPVSAERSMQKI